ncbi:MAG: hypothetical protein HEP71_08435 [Roseivirga sp.]|nr:hypothetical protein [Roseivirga sp.]
MLKKTLFSLLLTLVLAPAFAQQEDLTNFLKSFQTYQENNPVEKVFLHLDKTEYAQAETIWIKSYLVAGAGHLPSPFSKTLYVELVNEAGELTKRLTLRSEEGMSKASLVIPRNQEQGNYYLRAYTNWMKNQKQDFFFSKKIKIYSLKPGQDIVAKTIATDPELKFYPEGGHLVSEVSSRLAFELTGVDTKDKQYSGKIFDKNDQEVITFSTRHEGRGMVGFLPKTEGYYAMIDGFTERFNLPEIAPSGIVLSANSRNKDFITVSLKSNQPNKKAYYLVAHTRGYITYASQIRLTGTRGFSKINKTNLPEGITHVALLNEAMQPIGERLVFVDKQEGLVVKVSPNKDSYGPRELATVGIKVTDQTGKPVQGSFSLSAFNAGLVQNDQSVYNIRTHLLLGSDLPGHIKDPAQYFAGDEEANQQLDLLMMVNGWSRFDWSDLGQSEPENNYPVEIGLNLEGQLMKNNGGPAKDGKVLVVNASQGTAETPYALADEQGYFKFQNLHFYDTTMLRLQGFQRAGMKNVKFRIDSSFEVLPLKNSYEINSVFDNPLRVDAFRKYAKTALQIDSTYRRVNGITYLGDVTVTADKRKEKYRVLQSQYGEGESYLNFDEIPFEQKSGRDPYNLLLGRVAGFTMLPAQQQIGIDPSIKDDPIYRVPRLRQGPFVGAPLVFLDNVEIGWEQVYELQAVDIDYVEIYKSSSAAMFGTRGASGAIAIYTLKGKKMFENQPRPGMLFTKLPGYHAPREFYAPRYDTKRRQRYIPDERATIFWAPMISTNSDGEAMIDFYTPDQSGYVTIDLQGISLSGNTGFGSSGFSIRSDF